MPLQSIISPSTIVGLGLINKDFVAVVPGWERDAKVAATHYFEQIGGPVPVALMAMARLGKGNYHFISVTGDDYDATNLAALLTTEEITPHFVRAARVATSRSLVLLDARNGSRTLANYAEELPSLQLTEEHKSPLVAAKLLHLDGRDLPASLEAAKIVRDAGGIVSLDLGTMRPGREELIALCDIVIASRKGAAGAFPDIADNPQEQVRRFLQIGVRVAGVTLGERGVVIGTKGMEPLHLAAHRVENVVDTCGAGDLFHGAFLWSYLRTKDMMASADFAQKAVAVRIQRYGNHAGLPRVAEIEAFSAQTVSD